ncbi:hypothetical protein AV654_16550 [Paenibacillus elgii]|uniref:Butirosin biosynthesis protein H N-terminal domain-containing protein n=1 Tax=Paenibacillus elgii TaxID=189691 RepID=A0A165R5Z8_9BACL|nr:BtrH N-terminal domain-containing protein [Paenibacillus elgii]KZE79092.1 hypothetical protein AV654_16550 [Paenibacillus elgii]
MNYAPYIHNYHNCTQIIVAAMLKRLGAPTELVWNQAGFGYKDEGDYVIVDPYYTPVRRQLADDHGIDWIEACSPEAGELAIQLDEWLALGRTAGVISDMYELPYHAYYRQAHDSHAVEVIGMAPGGYVVCDHYYQYVGPISRRDLLAAMESYQSRYGGYKDLHLFYLAWQAEQNCTGASFDHRRAIQRNVDAMQGRPPEADLDETMRHGLPAIPVFGEKLMQLLETESEWLDLTHKMIKEVSFTRYHFHVFLGLCGLPELAGKALEASQHWQVMGNMVARGLLRKEAKSLRDRIEGRFARLLEAEADHTQTLAGWLLAHPDWSMPER